MRAETPFVAVLGLAMAGCVGRLNRPVEVVRVVAVPVPVMATPAPARAAAPVPAVPGKAVAAKRAPDLVARRRSQVEAAKEREPFVPLASDADTKVAVPSIRRIPEAPTLARAAAAMPRTLEAEMRAWMALQKEGTLDRKLLQEVFLVVSTTNDCGY